MMDRGIKEHDALTAACKQIYTNNQMSMETIEVNTFYLYKAKCFISFSTCNIVKFIYFYSPFNYFQGS